MGEQIREGIEEPFLDGSASVQLTDNLEDARRIYEAGHCDVLVADIVVKTAHDSRSADADAHDLLHSIKRSGQFVARIGHTAYREKLARIEQEGLVDAAFDKHDFSSTESLIEHSINVVQDMLSFRRKLVGGSNALREGAQADDTIDRQECLEECRRLFGTLIAPSFAPLDYRRTAILLSALMMRLSSVPSDRFDLRDITQEFCSHLESLIQSMCRQTFKYETDALPIFIKLEALGYPVVMRVDI